MKMKVISKIISRNEFISRKNGVIPSLVDEWRIPTMYISCKDEYPKEYIFNSYESAVAKINELGLSSSLLEYSGKFVYQDHNYGLVVSDVIIPKNIASKITDYTDIYVNIPITRDFIEYLQDIIDDPEEFKKLLKKYIGSDKISDFDESQPVYFDLNNPVRKNDPHYSGRKIVSGSTEQEIKILTYTTLNKWYTFFKDYRERFSKYYVDPYDNAAITYYRMEYEPKSEINEKEFVDLSNLFKARGGNDMYEWILENCMPHDDGRAVEIEFENATNAASYTIPILLTTSIDDLGQMSIFSSKWKAGVDYSNTINNGYGTVVDRPYKKETTGSLYSPYSSEYTTLNETFMIKEGKGYYQNKFHENQFNDADYINYTDYYVDSHPEEFKTDGVSKPITGYAYSPVNGKVIYIEQDSNITTEEETIKWNKEDFFLINGEYVKVIYGAYVEPNISDGYVANIDIKKGIKLPVYEDGALRYAELNGKKFYALKDDSDGKYYIYFTDINHHHDNGSKVIQSNGYILYNNKLYLLNNDSSVLIEDENGNKTVYYVLNGYFDYKGTKFYVSNNSVVVPKLDINIINDKKFITYDLEELDEDDLKYLGWESISANTKTTEVTISHKLVVKRADVVTGYSDSKLDLLRRKKVNADELGNELPGYLDLETSSGGTHYNTPYDQCTLDILYAVGEVTNLSLQKELDYGDGTKIYNGNYLESIEFYHKGKNDEKIDVIFLNSDNENYSGDSREFLKEYEEGGSYYRPGELLYCDITYYINATLEYDEPNYRYVLSEGRHKGVKYVNTSVVTKSVGDFYMSDGSKFTFNYYQLKCEMTSENLDDFKDVQLTNMDYFEMKILNNYDSIHFGEFNWDEYYGYWEKYNGMVSAPVFRTEYDLWSSTPQNLKSDIYIDRGINAAFEKHLKLEEVHTMDALENYSNGYFKINEY